MAELKLFELAPLKEAAVRRRTRSQGARGDNSLASRQDRVAKRNRVLIARYYYWTELCRRRFDDTLRILSDNEFFLEDRTVSNTLVSEDAFYNQLIKNKTSRKELRKMFPGFDWN